MGSSGGSSNFSRPSTPTPPNVAPFGQTSGFQPNWVNFLGDTNQPSTGLTPDMLQQIDSGAYAQPGNPIPGGGGGGMPGGDMRSMFAELMAQYERDKWKQTAFGGVLNGFPGGRMGAGGGGGGGRGGGYTTSGRSGAGSFGSRSSSASRAGGGLY